MCSAEQLGYRTMRVLVLGSVRNDRSCGGLKNVRSGDKGPSGLLGVAWYF